MNQPSQPSPDLFFDTITAYQKTSALEAALELNLFTQLADSPASAADVAAGCGASVRGIRILCDYLTVLGFLSKAADRYSLTPDSAVFLNRKSPAYLGAAAEFLVSDHLTTAFRDLAEAVRKGGTTQSGQGSVAPEHPMWLTFARVMGGMMRPAADGLAELVSIDSNRPSKILDVSASHGRWGIAFAQKYPQAIVVALDWAPVLEIARENAQAAGIAGRFRTVAGSAFEAELGGDYDAVLVQIFSTTSMRLSASGF